MKNSKNIKRYMKKEYGPRKMQFPKTLEFLSTSGVNFHAVVEDDSSGRVIRTIEIKPTTMKRLLQDIENLYSCLSDSDDLIKKLRADMRKLRSDNKKLIENHEHTCSLESKLKTSQERISVLNNEIKSSKNLNSEFTALETELTALRKKTKVYESELSDLEQERKALIALEIENIELRDEMEKLTKVNQTLMKNIEEIYEPNIKRSNDSFFGSDKKFTINNNKPYPGGKPS